VIKKMEEVTFLPTYNKPAEDHRQHGVVKTAHVCPSSAFVGRHKNFPDKQ
jgi:hypothetical protein